MRGAGTGTYGQGVPLRGGVVLKTRRLNKLCWSNEQGVPAEAGFKLWQLDTQARQQGLELRIHPSTKRVATVGRHFTGSSGGVSNGAGRLYFNGGTLS